MTTPPLLMLAEGRKPRPRKVPTRPKEIALHMAIAKVLREHCLPDWQWTAYSQRRTEASSNSWASRGAGRIIVLVPPLGQLHCLELKRIGEDLSATQEGFAKAISIGLRSGL